MILVNRPCAVGVRIPFSRWPYIYLPSRAGDEAGVRTNVSGAERESLAAPGAIAGTTAVRCDVAAPAITGAKLPRNSLENVNFTGQLL